MSERSFRRAQARKAAAASRRDAARRRAGLVVGAAVGASALFTAAAQADTFTVDSLSDGATGDACDVGFTLRCAVEAANANPGADTITFTPGLAGAITLNSGELGINEDTTITGPGADQLTVTADDNSRIFQVQDHTTFTMSGLTLTGGDLRGSGDGGAIYGQSTSEIVVSASTISGNQAESGGAISNSQGAVRVTDSTLANNFAKYNGGAIAVDRSDLHISGSALTSNEADRIGGAVYAEGTASGPFSFKYVSQTTDIDSSTITGNAAQSGGGVGSTATALTLTDSTIDGNTASQSGGGFVNAGKLDLQRSKVSGNTAAAGGGGVSFTVAPSRVDATTISGNRATGGEVDGVTGFGVLGGGGLISASVKYGTVISNSTISGNTVDPAEAGDDIEQSGGGLQLLAILGTGSTRVEESTISGNTADRGAGIEVSSKYGDTVGSGAASLDVRGSTIASNAARVTGGGIHLSATTLAPTQAARRDAGDAGTSSVALSSSVVADNTAAGAAQDLTTDGASDSFGGFDAFFSLIENPGNAAFRTSVASTSGIDPQLGALADNGGPTQTQAPSGTSPLIDRGKAAADAQTDQRGSARVVDTALANAPAGDGSDIGAVELPVGSVVGGAGSTGTPIPVTPGTTPPVIAQKFTATIRNRALGERDVDGKPNLLLANSTNVGCNVTVGAIKLCAVEVRAPAAITIPGGRKVAKGALLASGLSRITRDAKSTSVKVKLTPIGVALLGRRPLGVPALVVAKGVSTTGAHTVSGVVRLLKSNAIRIAVPQRSATLPQSVLTQLNAAASVFKRTAKVTCDAYTDDGPASLALTTLQAKGACSALVKAGIKARTVARGHSTTHPRTPLSEAARLKNRRIVLRFTF